MHPTTTKTQAHEGLLVRIRCTPVGWLGLALRSTGPRVTTVGCSPPRTNTQRMSLQHEPECKEADIRTQTTAAKWPCRTNAHS